MSENTTYLIDQLDKMLQGEDNAELQAKLREDKALAEEWKELQIAMATIREAGLKEQVDAIGKSYRKAQIQPAKHSQAVVRTMYRNVFRVAATVVLLVAVTAIYKYSSVNSSGFYKDHFTDFELSNSRGETKEDLLEKAYRAKNWAEVINQFNALQIRNNKSYFLAGMANLELRDPAASIPLFSQVLQNNAKGADTYFHDESEYYLALCYLAYDEPLKAIPILERIKSDKNHLYNRMVNEMSWTDLKIIRFKNRK